MFYVLAFHGKMGDEYYQIEITIHPQLFPFTLGPTFTQPSTLLPTISP